MERNHRRPPRHPELEGRGSVAGDKNLLNRGGIRVMEGKGFGQLCPDMAKAAGITG